jgi:tellurite resistance protein TerC
MTPRLEMWILFNLLVAGMLWVDLGSSAKEEKPVSMRQAAWRSAAWIALGLAFGGVIAVVLSPKDAMDYLTAYLIEKSLSVDNLFVFIMIFSYFKVDAAHQPRVLKWGILGAVVLRLILIMAGGALVHRFEWIFYVFGAVLIYTAWKMAFGHEKPFDPEGHFLLRFMRWFLPVTGLRGNAFFVTIDGRRHATTLFLALVMVEASDIAFAVDSIPAVFGVTTDTFIAYTSNVFAILGLRALYFLLQGLMGKFTSLKYGVSLILAFVGCKMLLIKVAHVPTPASLAVVVGILAASVLYSVFRRNSGPP